MKKHTLQSIFDISAAHLLTQGERSLQLSCDAQGGVEMHKCMYRSTTGLRCAVGIFIPDSLYHPIVEGISVLKLFLPLVKPDVAAQRLRSALEAVGIDTSDEAQIELLQALQQCHDGTDPEEWVSELDAIAMSFKLNPAVVLAAEAEGQP